MPALRKYKCYALLLALSSCWACAATGTMYYNFGRSQNEYAALQNVNLFVTQTQKFSQLIERMMTYRMNVQIKDNEDQKRYEESKAAASDILAILHSLTKQDANLESRMNEIQHHFLNLMEKLDTLPPRVQKSDGILTWKINSEMTQGLRATHTDITRVAQDLAMEGQKQFEIHIKALQNIQTSARYMRLGIDLLFVMLLTIAAAYGLHGHRETAELESSGDIYRLASEGSSDGIFEWNLRKGKAFYSTQFWLMLGYAPGHFPETMQSFKDLLHDDDRNRVLTHLDKYLSGELSEYSVVFRMRHQSGKWIWINARARALYDEKGKPIRIVGAHTDISRIKAYEEKLRQSKENAERANRAKTDFLAHMSHEIRTPLTAISGIAEIFSNMPTSLNEKQRQLVRVLGASTSSLKDLVTDILDFSKIESGELALEERRFELKGLFEQVISISALKAGEKSISFSFDYSDVRHLSFFGDSLRLRQILLNLIGNAIKFTDKGNVHVTAVREERNLNPVLIIKIRDTGIGIDPQHFDLIFERFKQADSSVSRRYGGSGLGLAISLRLARLMDGDILVESQPGHGSTFTLTVPFKGATTATEQLTVIDRNDTPSESVQIPPLHAHHILLVEDYEGTVAILSYLLEELSCSYDVARTGVQALELLRQKTYDLVLMDVQMPEMDGFTATARIREEERAHNRPHIPIIGMTAHALLGDKEKCIEAGMDAYLAKPIVEQDLKSKIFEFLKEKKSAA